MIAISLQDAIVERMKTMFAGRSFKKPLLDGTTGEGEMLIFPQSLPTKQSESDIQFPFVIVKLMHGRKEKADIQARTRIGFIIGIYDDAIDNQGYRDLVNVMNEIVSSLEEFPILGDMYELSYPLEASIYEEDTAPQWLGSIDTYWDAPNTFRKDVEGLI